MHRISLQSRVAHRKTANLFPTDMELRPTVSGYFQGFRGSLFEKNCLSGALFVRLFGVAGIFSIADVDFPIPG